MLVDEQFGSDIPQRAKQAGLKLAMPVEKSGQNEFDFQYGDEFGAHIEKFDPDFSKVLVRYNPDDPDTEMNERQLGRLKVLADWLHEQRPEVPVRAARAGHRRAAGQGRRRHRPLRRRAAPRADAPGDRGAARSAAIEVDVWKIEGVDAREDAEMLAEQARAGEGREGVTCVLLGRGASTEKVEQWLQAASTVEGFIGFAIGRSIWWDALKGWLAKELDRPAAVAQVADNYLHFVDVYERQKVA